MIMINDDPSSVDRVAIIQRTKNYHIGGSIAVAWAQSQHDCGSRAWESCVPVTRYDWGLGKIAAGCLNILS
jgi:hypothetical protein